MKTSICLLLLLLLSAGYVLALPQIDEESITDEKKFLVDNSQCIARARSGQAHEGGGFAENAAIGAATGAGTSAAFGAMTGGGIGGGVAIGAVTGGITGGAGSGYQRSQPNEQIYSNCMIKRGYKFLNSDNNLSEQ